VAVAPNRRRRPGVAGEAEVCPFCAGHEELTPPETYRVGTGDTWTARVVPNLYPAFERQEVVVHSPRHVETFAELSDDELAAVAEAWQARFEAAGDEGFPYVHALVNEGRAAGSSLPHSHSQLIWLREPPPAVVSESADGLDTLLHDEALALGDEPVRAVVHPAGRVPYECVIGAPEPDGFELAAALDVLRDLVRRLRALEGAASWNAWLHHLPRPHLELVPRLTVFAGVELGAGIYVNTVAPEDAAAALRKV
jgi:UDPglucose--hexose-1-phosphate uridylyltransferase